MATVLIPGLVLVLMLVRVLVLVLLHVLARAAVRVLVPSPFFHLKETWRLRGHWGVLGPEWLAEAFRPAGPLDSPRPSDMAQMVKGMLREEGAYWFRLSRRQKTVQEPQVQCVEDRLPVTTRCTSR